MTALDSLLPAPGLLETDHVDVAVPPEVVWDAVRHGDLAKSPLVRALFEVRTVFSRLGSDREPLRLHIDDIVSTHDRPGFQVLCSDAPREIIVGAIGQVWKPDIPFVHVESFAEYGRFDRPGYVKVAWSIQLEARGEIGTRITFELRAEATDEASWQKFRRYFHVIGPASRFIRRSLLATLERELGSLDGVEDDRHLPGDELIPDAMDHVTHSIDIHAKPEAIWPWLVQMGCRRGGFYAIDLLDNGGAPSAREIHPELQTLRVGDVVPATPEGEDGFEVLRLERHRAFVLGVLVDGETGRGLPFHAPRPDRFWQSTWAFVLEPLDAETTRLHARARVTFRPRSALRLAWMRSIHHLMERAQLRHLAARAEGRLRRDQLRDVLEGAGGAALMLLSFMTPFLRDERSHWGLSEEDASRTYPGDELVEQPRWQWTHAVEIDAPAEKVWPWVAQIGADRGGFYSYQWLENVAGCNVRNAERIHPEWQVRRGGKLSLHPKMPPLDVVLLSPGRSYVAHAPADPDAKREGRPWVEATWLFLVEPIGTTKCRVVSRYRVATSEDLLTRVGFGPLLVEPIGFAMDRRMLLGIKKRAEA